MSFQDGIAKLTQQSDTMRKELQAYLSRMNALELFNTSASVVENPHALAMRLHWLRLDVQNLREQLDAMVTANHQMLADIDKLEKEQSNNPT